MKPEIIPGPDTQCQQAGSLQKIGSARPRIPVGESVGHYLAWSSSTGALQFPGDAGEGQSTHWIHDPPWTAAHYCRPWI